MPPWIPKIQSIIIHINNIHLISFINYNIYNISSD